MGDLPLASFSLTHVHYNPADPVSHLCAWLALVPQGLCVAYATLIWSTREAEIMLMFAGQMGCEALNFLLKRYIKEERPKQMLGKGYGMPSSHAQFLAYFAVYISLFLLLRHKPADSSSPRSAPAPLPSFVRLPSTFSQHLLLSALFLALAASVGSSRVYLSYHTPKQVLVGCTAGVVTAGAWFAVTCWLRREGWLEWALHLWPARALRMRDLLPSQDLVEGGWREWERARTEKQEKGQRTMRVRPDKRDKKTR